MIVRPSFQGFAKPASGGGAVSRGIIFNGTTQNAHRTLPNIAPFTSLGAFSMEFRIRAPASTAGAFIFQMRNFAESPQFDLSNSSGGTQLAFNDYRDSVQFYITPTTYSDSLYRLQYDPANTRWTVESWNSDGSNRVQSTGTITTTSNWSLGSGLFTIASNYYDGAYLAQKQDFFRWHNSVVALNSSPPPATAAVGPTYYAKWEFEDNGNDSASSAGNLTLAGTPTYENTP